MRGLSLHHVSERSRQVFGRSTRFGIPHNLYSRLKGETLAPSIEQILALSHVTNYRFPDWLEVFRFDLDRSSGLQFLIPRRRTILLDPAVHDAQAWIPWFADRPQPGPEAATAPLGRLLATAPPQRACEILARNTSRFLYAVVGEQDLYALPYFSPGCVVRANPRPSREPALLEKMAGEGRYFLLECDFGWTCSQVLLTAGDRIVLHSVQRLCLQRELRLGTEARILGVIDAEIRPLSRARRAVAVPGAVALRKPARKFGPDRPLDAGELFRQARLKAGFSFREASSFSRLIAAELADEIYFAAPSTISDYETLTEPPRHVQKILTLCILYGVAFEECFRAFRLPLGLAGNEPIPDEFIPRTLSSGSLPEQLPKEIPSAGSGFLNSFLGQWEEVPLFLRNSLQTISGLKSFSLADLFWVGQEHAPLHPWLENAALVAVNRRATRPPSPTQKPSCETSLYVILRRDGTYLCGRCTLEGDHLVLHAYPGNKGQTQEFGNAVDAEVVGRITAILRKLP